MTSDLLFSPITLLMGPRTGLVGHLIACHFSTEVIESTTLNPFCFLNSYISDLQYRTLNHRINHIHERALRFAYKDYQIDFGSLLDQRNLVHRSTKRNFLKGVWYFLTDLLYFCHAKSRCNIHFALGGQIFEFKKIWIKNYATLVIFFKTMFSRFTNDFSREKCQSLW